ncbi:hypothetical protein U1Q18_031204 [Sarracenia purpurea var. burkii]
MEVEDDEFLADLNRQISLLIMDDDEDPVSPCPSVSLQAFAQAIHPAAHPPSSHEQICRSRESKGTGVFIPQSSHPRRKNRQGKLRSSSSNTKLHSHSVNNNNNSRGINPAPASNYINFIPSQDYSSHPKR